MKVLVLGATGLLGNAMFRSLSNMPGAEVTGTVRQETARALFDPALAARLTVVGNIEDPAQQAALFDALRPDVVVNCVAVGRPAPADPMRSVAIYAVLPQRLSQLCHRTGARFIQISSDGVFAGHRGAYTEADMPDADDVYGTSKFLGEVDAPHAVTLRTSIIGHELQGGSGLLEWFLSQQGECRCLHAGDLLRLPDHRAGGYDPGCRDPAAGPLRHLSRCDPADLEVRSAIAGCRAIRQKDQSGCGRSAGA